VGNSRSDRRAAGIGISLPGTLMRVTRNGTFAGGTHFSGSYSGSGVILAETGEGQLLYSRVHGSSKNAHFSKVIRTSCPEAKSRVAAVSLYTLLMVTPS
jgi:hypothetical protein